jgi:subtilisin family serine protease
MSPWCRRLGWAVALLLAAPATSRAGEVGTAVLDALRAAGAAGARARVRVIVSLSEPQAPVRSLTNRLAEVDAAQRRVLDSLSPVHFRVTARWDTLAGLAGDVDAEGLAALLASPEVRRVDLEPEARIHLGVSVPMIRAREVQDAGFGGQGVVVAVIDTGVESTHPDLSGDVVEQACFCTTLSGAGCCPNGTGQQTGAGAAEDDHGHGTNVASIISGAGRVAPSGVAPDSRLVAIKVVDKTGSGSGQGTLSALDYVLKSRPEVKVVNISLGLGSLYEGACDNATSSTQILAQAVNGLKSRGTAVVASSGNEGNKSQISLPACLSSVIAVGAVYERSAGTITFGCTDAATDKDQVTCFSNSSTKLDVLAPGAPILGAGLHGGTSTTLGTSQACPHVAGAAALLFSANSGLSVDKLIAALKTSSVTVTDRANGRATPRLDAKAALDASR